VRKATCAVQQVAKLIGNSLNATVHTTTLHSATCLSLSNGGVDQLLNLRISREFTKNRLRVPASSGDGPSLGLYLTTLAPFAPPASVCEGVVCRIHPDRVQAVQLDG
jgi:hypothetical protein